MAIKKAVDGEIRRSSLKNCAAEFLDTSMRSIMANGSTVAHSKLIKPAELHDIDGVFRLH